MNTYFEVSEYTDTKYINKYTHEYTNTPTKNKSPAVLARYLVSNVGVHPRDLLHRVAHGDIQAVARRRRQRVPSGHVNVR